MQRLRLALAVLAATLATLAAHPSRAADAGTAPAAAPAPTTLAEGQAAPEFKLPSTTGHDIRLRDLRGKTVVLYFYPKDETPGCTHEACDFRDHMSALDSAGVVVLGVSNDDITSHQQFRDKEHLPFTLLADASTKVSRAYGVYKSRDYNGKTWTGIERTTFVIDKDGRIARVWPKVNVNGHVDDVLAFVKPH